MADDYNADIPNLDPVNRIIMQKLIQDRKALIDLLMDGGVRDFANQNRLLAEIQACVVSVDRITQRMPNLSEQPSPSQSVEPKRATVLTRMTTVGYGTDIENPELTQELRGIVENTFRKN